MSQTLLPQQQRDNNSTNSQLWRMRWVFLYCVFAVIITLIIAFCLTNNSLCIYGVGLMTPFLYSTSRFLFKKDQDYELDRKKIKANYKELNKQSAKRKVIP